MTTPLKIIFAGTPGFAVPALRALQESSHQVVAVYTQPDRPAGRGRKLRVSPVKELALRVGLPVYQPLSLKDVVEQRQLAALEPDLMVVVAYGLMLSRILLETPRHGCMNIHASLLPRWRGAAPIQRAVYNGDAETGVTIMQMDIGLDSGDVLNVLRRPISPDDSSASLHDALSVLGAEALLATLEDLQADRLRPQPQDEAQMTYATKLSKSEAEINWQRPATEIARQVMAFNPWPVAQTPLGDQVLRIWRAHALNQPAKAPPGSVVGASNEGLDVACGEGILRVLELQRPGKKAMPAADFIHAYPLEGIRLGDVRTPTGLS